jgi:glycosyltransferase involved in cell wall biosynthesis
MLFNHLRSFQQALLQWRTPAPAGVARIRYIYANEGASARYRVFHGVEASQSGGMHASATSLAVHSGLYQLHDVDLLVFHRIALGPRSMLLLLLARRYGIRVAFESDDLIWDVRQREYEFLDRHYPPVQVQRILHSARRTLALMRRVDYCILATPYLAGLAQAASNKPTAVLLNAVSAEMQHHAARVPTKTATDLLRIGYFSGHARVHDEDLATIGSVLAQILAAHPQVLLTLVGEVAVPRELLPYTQRIERRPVVDWRLLASETARVDIAIAPLIDNPQRRAKSAVKYLEAGLVAVPLVAVHMEPYQHEIVHGQTGMLAGNSTEWLQALESLIQHSTLRQTIGSAARQDILAKHTTQARARQWQQIVEAMKHVSM